MPIREAHNDYAKEVAEALGNAGVRVEADFSDANMQNKIKKFKLFKDPYILVLGDKEVESRTVSINMRGSKVQAHDVPLDEFVEFCRKLNKERTLELALPGQDAE